MNTTTTMFCQTCLSTDRKIIEIDSIKSLISKCRLDDILTTGSICWECRRMIRRLAEFHTQIRVAQNTLKKKVFKDIKSLSRLRQHKCLINMFLFDDEGTIKYKNIQENIEDKNTPDNIADKNRLQIKEEEENSLHSIKEEPLDPDIKNEPNEILNHFDNDNCDNIFIDTFEGNQTLKQELGYKKKTRSTYNCKKCNMQFRYYPNYEAHLKTHYKYTCDLCNDKFNAKSLLIEHIKTHSTEEVKKSSYCELCEKQFKNLKSYYYHVQNNKRHMVVNDMDFIQCPHCDKTFTVQSSLKAHVRFYHLKISKYKCEPCGRIFQSQYKLTNHNQVHHNEVRHRNHPCRFCGKKYYSAHDRQSHELLHSSERAYMCTECGATYKQRSGLHNHSRVVHGYRSGQAYTGSTS